MLVVVRRLVALIRFGFWELERLRIGFRQLVRGKCQRVEFQQRIAIRWKC